MEIKPNHLNRDHTIFKRSNFMLKGMQGFSCNENHEEMKRKEANTTFNDEWLWNREHYTGKNKNFYGPPKRCFNWYGQLMHEWTIQHHEWLDVVLDIDLWITTPMPLTCIFSNLMQKEKGKFWASEIFNNKYYEELYFPFPIDSHFGANTVTEVNPTWVDLLLPSKEGRHLRGAFKLMIKIYLLY